MINFSPEVKAILGETTQQSFQSLDDKAKFLVVLNAKAQRSGSEVFAGVSSRVRDRRRAKNRVARRSRRINRGC